MAILIEAISIVIKRSVIDQKFPGGWAAFMDDCPNQTLCADSSLARVGFMIPVDVKSYVEHLEKFGFIYRQAGEAIDLNIADQQRGLLANCDWVEFVHVNLDNDPSKRVAGCQLIGGVKEPLSTPYKWQYDGSLSQTFVYAPTEHVDRSLEFLRHENGIDVYFNKLTNQEVYLGRTGDN